MTLVPNDEIRPVGRTDDLLNNTHVRQGRESVGHYKLITPLTPITSIEIINLAEEITTSICQELYTIYGDRDIVPEECFSSIIEDRITEFLIDKGLT